MIKKNAKNKLFCGMEIATTIFLGAAMVFCIIIVAQIMSKGYVNIFGYSLFRVETGSMEPTITTGALLICKEAEIEVIETGDIICYRSKSQQMLGQVITHRVVDIIQSEDGTILLETRGDANTVKDGFYVTRGNLVGKVVWYSGEKNLLAEAIGFVTGKIGFLSCIVIPVLLISGVLLRDSVKDIQKELKALETLQQQAGNRTETGRANEQAESLAETDTEKQRTALDTLTPEEYENLVQQLKAEIMEELKQSAEGHAE